jgi:hypothetical protein
MAEGAENVATDLIGRLEQAWNEADGRAFGEPFSADADFVTTTHSWCRSSDRDTVPGLPSDIAESLYPRSFLGAVV